jgi:hypothetical protein
VSLPYSIHPPTYTTVSANTLTGIPRSKTLLVLWLFVNTVPSMPKTNRPMQLAWLFNKWPGHPFVSC